MVVENYKVGVVSLDIGSDVGKVNVVTVQIMDDIPSGDIVHVPGTVAVDIVSNLYGTEILMSPGGKYNQFTASDFYEYGPDYPKTTDTTETNVHAVLKCTASSSMNAVVSVQIYVGSYGLGQAYATRSSGQLAIPIIWRNSEGKLLSCTFSNIQLIATIESTNSFTHCRSISGAPVGTVVGYNASGGTALTNVTAIDSTLDDIGAEEVDIDTDDPYAPGGTSGTGGGTGTFSGTGDSIGIPSLPTLSAVDTGFITLFNPSIAQLQALSSYMWSDLFSIDSWKKVFADPMDAILGMSIVPVNVPAGGAKSVTVGNISTGIAMTTAASQYVEVDCGTLNVQEYWGSYLDYDPYTKCEIFLPYCGMHPLKVDDVMNNSVHVVYHVDILSGACCSYVQCGSSVIYSFNGQCSASVPITGDNFTNVINGVLGIAGSVGSLVASGGLSAATAVGAAVSTAQNVMAMKPSVERSGAFGSMGGMLGVQTPYLILTRPRQCLPAGQNVIEGYPSYITSRISSLSGYTEFEEIHLENLPCTDEEKEELESLLKSGVII